MLDLDVRSEAHALRQHERDGDDPEYVATLWVGATMAEFLRVVSEAVSLGLARRSEWTEDTLSAHKWLRRRGGRVCPGEGCTVVVYNDGGAWFDARTNTTHGCHVVEKGLTQWACSCGRHGVFFNLAQRDAFGGCPAQCAGPRAEHCPAHGFARCS